VTTPRRGAGRLAVRISADVWREEAERFGVRSQPRTVAERERHQLEREGARLSSRVSRVPDNARARWEGSS
jgi:hypothetical protein